jgi:hypothetical protein
MYLTKWINNQNMAESVLYVASLKNGKEQKFNSS